MDSADSPLLARHLDDVDDADHVSPSLETHDHTQPPAPSAPPAPLTVTEIEASSSSLLPGSSPLFAVGDTDTFAHTVTATNEDSGVVLVHETVLLSPKNTAADSANVAANAAVQPALLGEDASQDILLMSAPTEPTEAATAVHVSGIGTQQEDEESAVIVVMTGEGEEEHSKHEEAQDPTDDADAVRGAAIQDKYSVTSEWVESLPFAATPSLLDNVVNVDDTQEDKADKATPSAAPARRGKRARDEKEKAESGADAGGGTARQRRAREKAAEAELQTAFKHSQRALRKQAKSVNMRDVFSRSLALQSPLQLSDGNANSGSTFPSSPLFTEATAAGGGGSVGGRSGHLFSPSPNSFRFGTPVFSPTGGALSPTTPSNSSSAWSPCVVGELTNQFLASVKQQRRQKCEQFVSRELTQSQTLSQTRSFQHHLHGDDDLSQQQQRQQHGNSRQGETAASQNAFSVPVDELVIGDEDNEAANWMPAETASPASPHGRRMLRDTSANDDVVLLGGASAGEDGLLRSTTSPSTTTASESRRADELASQQQEQQVMQSLSRKHEIWKLKQRQLKAQQQVDLDERAKVKQQQLQQHQLPAVKSSATTSSLTISTSVTKVNASRALTEEVVANGAASASANVLTGASSATYQTLFRNSQISSPTSTTSRTLHKTTLTADAISMIRRINSFDNTSTQRVVVFGTAASAKQSKEENTQ